MVVGLIDVEYVVVVSAEVVSDVVIGLSELSCVGSDCSIVEAYVVVIGVFTVLCVEADCTLGV